MPSDPKKKNSLSEEIEKSVTTLGAILSRAGARTQPETPVELSGETKALLEDIRKRVHHDPTPEQAQKIAGLISQLGSGVFQEREDASTGLREFKYAAKSALDAAKDDKDPEIRIVRVPPLLKALTEQDGNLIPVVSNLRTIPLREWKTAWKTASPDLVSLLDQTDNLDLQEEIYSYFQITGGLNVKEAPALMRIFKDGRTPEQKYYAIESLELVAPDLPDAEVKNIVSSFTHAFEADTLKDDPLSCELIEVLGRIGPRANVITPKLADIVADDSYLLPLRKEGIDSLIKITPGMPDKDVKSIVSKIIEPTIDPKAIILLDQEELDGDNKDIGVTLLEKLGKFGANAEPALPKLMEILKAGPAHSLIKDAAGGCLKTVACNLPDEKLQPVLKKLMDIAQDTKNESHGRFVAFNVIGSIGARAKSVIPDLQKLVDSDTATDVFKGEARGTIEQIKADKGEKVSSSPPPPPPSLPLFSLPKQSVPGR